MTSSILPANAVQLRIMLLDTMPNVWRRVVVPDDIELPDLHTVLVLAMGWQGWQPHEFEFDAVRFGEPVEDWIDDQIRNEHRVSLRKALGPTLRHFDYAARWRHWVIVENIRPGGPRRPRARCTGGRHACPPEHVGGAARYREFLRIIADPEHADHEYARSLTDGLFDPQAFSRETVNAMLREVEVA